MTSARVFTQVTIPKVEKYDTRSKRNVSLVKNRVGVPASTWQLTISLNYISTDFDALFCRHCMQMVQYILTGKRT